MSGLDPDFPIDPKHMRSAINSATRGRRLSGLERQLVDVCMTRYTAAWYQRTRPRRREPTRGRQDKLYIYLGAWGAHRATGYDLRHTKRCRLDLVDDHELLVLAQPSPERVSPSGQRFRGGCARGGQGVANGYVFHARLLDFMPESVQLAYLNRRRGGSPVLPPPPVFDEPPTEALEPAEADEPAERRERRAGARARYQELVRARDRGS